MSAEYILFLAPKYVAPPPIRDMAVVIAEVLNSVTTETYPFEAPKGFKLPLIVFTPVTTTYHDDLDDADDTGRVLFRIDCYARTLREAKALSKEVRSAMRHFTSREVQATTLKNEMSMVDHTTETKLHRVTLDIDVFGVVRT